MRTWASLAGYLVICWTVGGIAAGIWPAGWALGLGIGAAWLLDTAWD